MSEVAKALREALYIAMPDGSMGDPCALADYIEALERLVAHAADAFCECGGDPERRVPDDDGGCHECQWCGERHAAKAAALEALGAEDNDVE